MSVYVGIDVHRKRSQVAVIDEGGKVLANRNVSNGVRQVLSVIGGLPAGTPAAYEAAFGWGWLLELLEGYGFEPHVVHPLQCKAIASARLKNDKVDAATLAQLLERPGPAVARFTRAAGGLPRGHRRRPGADGRPAAADRPAG
jgi:transposase